MVWITMRGFSYLAFIINTSFPSKMEKLKWRISDAQWFSNKRPVCQKAHLTESQVGE
jgi:hypothetical protein